MEPTNIEPTTIDTEVKVPVAIQPAEKKETNYVLPSAILIASILISGSILYSNGVSGGNSLAKSAKTTAGAPSGAPSLENMKPVDKNDHIRGNLDARIIVVEYSDPECPYCKVFHATMQRLMSEYGGDNKLAWVYRNFPIDSLHSKAREEAEANECASVVGGNGAYWSYLDELFKRTNSNNSLDLAQLPLIATDIGLNLSQFNKCVESGKTKEKVDSDTADAIASGARGTPFNVLINAKTGEKTEIMGAQPYDVLKQKIEAVLLTQ